jgi:hypothetical protein
MFRVFPNSVLTIKERQLFHTLRTPQKIQDYLDTLPTNFEIDGDTHYSPRKVLEKNTAHCIEGALLSAAILWYHGRRPLLLDLRTRLKDDEHVVALYREGRYWGALSKTNHAVLRYRDPIYKSVRELTMSYAHEYFRDADGVKTLVSYSRPVDLSRIDPSWITTSDDLFYIDDILNRAPHYCVVPKYLHRYLRPATRFERRVINTAEWSDPSRK